MRSTRRGRRWRHSWARGCGGTQIADRSASDGPSGFVNPSSLNYCRPIKRHEIDKVIGQFGDAADVAVAAGFDAIELHFGHLYLPSSFLSPKMNRRKDEYGGSIDNRSRFVRQIAQRCARSWEAGSRSPRS